MASFSERPGAAVETGKISCSVYNLIDGYLISRLFFKVRKEKPNNLPIRYQGWQRLALPEQLKLLERNDETVLHTWYERRQPGFADADPLQPPRLCPRSTAGRL
jgi:hypothetical protein